MDSAINTETNWSSVTHLRLWAPCQSYYSERFTYDYDFDGKTAAPRRGGTAGLQVNGVLFTFDQIKPHEYKITWR